MATCPSISAARLAFCLCFIRFVLVAVLSGKPKQNRRRGLADQKLVQAPSNFIAGRPKAARCYLWLFLLYITIKIGKNSC